MPTPALMRLFDDAGSMPRIPAAPFPVVGICEAALVTAGQIAGSLPSSPRCRARWCRSRNWSAVMVLLERARVSAVRDVAVLDIERPGSGAMKDSKLEIARALEAGAEAIVLGCAGMADLAAALSQKFDIPVVDGVAAAVKQAEALSGLKLRTSRSAGPTRRRSQSITPGCSRRLHPTRQADAP